MFDIGWSELFVIAIVALIVIGPKDLPQAFRMVGQWVARARAMAREFQGHFDELMRETQVDEMKREFQEMTRTPAELEGLEDELMAGRPALEKPKIVSGEKKDEASVEGAPVVETPPAETIPPDDKSHGAAAQ